jgi:homoserine dehydrogenase
VGGGIPIIANLSQCLTANQIVSVQGILNGTSNFITSQMDEEGQTYAEALREAQQRGYAEADPTVDVDGSDAAQKLAILAHLAFGAQLDWERIPRVGIQTLDPVDLHCAREMGYCVKLLSVARRNDRELELHVSPTLVRLGTPLAEVRGAYNAVEVVGDAVGRVLYHGLGAGQMPTASAVVADMIDIAVGRMPITFRTQGLWSPDSPDVDLADHARLQMRYYLRFRVLDRPGVLAEISGVLGRQQISVASVIQHETVTGDGASESDVVSLVIMTHTTTAGAVDSALVEIERLDSVRGECVRMPVQEPS